MFEKIRDFFWAPEKGNVYLGTDKAFEDNILIPLTSGQSKNKFQNSDIDKVSVAMTCVKVLSNTFSRIPIRIFNENDPTNTNLRSDPRYKLLYYSPDGLITGQQFWLALEFNRLLKGNSFARIRRNTNTGQAIMLEIIPSNRVSGYKTVRGQHYYTIITPKVD